MCCACEYLKYAVTMAAGFGRTKLLIGSFPDSHDYMPAALLDLAFSADMNCVTTKSALLAIAECTPEEPQRKTATKLDGRKPGSHWARYALVLAIVVGEGRAWQS